MAARLPDSPGRLRSVALALIVAALTFTAATVVLAEEVIDDEKLIIDLGGVVYSENCDPCHGNIADTDNFASEIIFKHGYHQLIACSGCHTRFPHRREGTELPTMKGCWNCHGLQHGPMGELATGRCEDCHKTARARLRPAFHEWDWAAAPHVEPGRERLQTQCMMCHDKPWCVDCHEDEGIDWDPGVPYVYDSSSGCQACHGNENLTKISEGRPKSFQVVGVDDSAHADLTCQQCHADYNYEQAAGVTPLWNVNAGLACRQCHASAALFPEEERDAVRAVVREYDDSIHADGLGEWMRGVAGADPTAGTQRPPTCADCHGGHFIQRLDNNLAQQLLHASAYRVCARCHAEEYESYDDYYHGAAYKRGAVDSPACWDCHAAHKVLPSSDSSSTVSAAALAQTCGQEGCHRGSEEAFAENAGELIHQKAQAADENPLRRLLKNVRGWFS